jgi:hypothetical protein
VRQFRQRGWLLIFITLIVFAGVLLIVNNYSQASRFGAKATLVVGPLTRLKPEQGKPGAGSASATQAEAPIQVITTTAPLPPTATARPTHSNTDRSGVGAGPTPNATVVAQLANPPAAERAATATAASEPGPKPTATPSPAPTATPRPKPTNTPKPPTVTPAPQGHAYYVDSVHGSDDNAGNTPAAAWQSLRPINARKFGPGDTINLARGSNWTGPGGESATLVIQGAGHPDAPITVQAYGSGDRPVLRNPSDHYSKAVSVIAPWTVVQGLLLREARQAGVSIEAGADHVVVQDNEMSAVGSGVLVWSQYNYIVRNYVHDTTLVENSAAPDSNYGADGVLLHASNNEVAYNRFINCKAASQNYGYDGGAVEFFGDVNNISIHNNYAYNADGFTEVGGGSAHQILIAYNVIVNSGPVVGLHAGGRFASDIEGFQFVNNTVVDTVGAYSLIYIEGTLKNGGVLTVRNNIFYVKGYTMLLQNPQPFTHDHNLYNFAGTSPEINFQFGDGEQTGDPMFVDMYNGDYRLLPQSPAIKAGAVMSALQHDFAGVNLPANAPRELGAYQFKAGS